MKATYSETDFRNPENFLSMPSACISSIAYIFLVQKFWKTEHNIASIGFIFFFGIDALLAAATINFIQHKRKITQSVSSRALLTWITSVLFVLVVMYFGGVIASFWNSGIIKALELALYGILVLIFPMPIALIVTFPAFLFGLLIYWFLIKLYRT